MIDKFVNALAECVSIEASTLSMVVPKYQKVATELAVLFAGPNGSDKVHVYMVAAQDSTVSGDAWNRAITGLNKALGKLPDPLKFAAKRDFRPSHRDKSPLFKMVRVADANEERKANAEAEKAQAEAAEVAAALDAQNAREEADAATTERMVADVALETVNRLGLNPYKLLEIIAESFGADTRGAVVRLNNHYVVSPDLNEAAAVRSRSKAKVAAVA